MRRGWTNQALLATQRARRRVFELRPGTIERQLLLLRRSDSMRVVTRGLSLEQDCISQRLPAQRDMRIRKQQIAKLTNSARRSAMPHLRRLMTEDGAHRYRQSAWRQQRTHHSNKDGSAIQYNSRNMIRLLWVDTCRHASRPSTSHRHHNACSESAHQGSAIQPE